MYWNSTLCHVRICIYLRLLFWLEKCQRRTNACKGSGMCVRGSCRADKRHKRGKTKRRPVGIVHGACFVEGHETHVSIAETELICDRSMNRHALSHAPQSASSCHYLNFDLTCDGLHAKRAVILLARSHTTETSPFSRLNVHFLIFLGLDRMQGRLVQATAPKPHQRPI